MVNLTLLTKHTSFTRFTMPSDAKKKRQQQKKQAVKAKDLPKKKTEQANPEGEDTPTENGAESNGVNGISNGASGMSEHHFGIFKFNSKRLYLFNIV